MPRPRPRLLRRHSAADWLDVVLPGALVAACVVTGIVTSLKKPLWYDELFGWTLATDPSLPHALRALADGADAGTPLFFVTSWLSVRAIGRGELAYRAVGGLCFALTLIVLWRTFRRAYPPRAVALGLATAIGASAATAYQFSEGRYYGLMTLAVAVAIARAVADDRPDLSVRSRLATAISHATLVYAHVFGFFYSAAFLAASVVRDAVHGRFRAGRYLPIVAAWVAFLPWLPALRRQSDLAKPHSWISAPNLTKFAGAYLFEISPLPVVVLLAVAFGLAANRSEEPSPSDERDSLLIIAYALFGIPLAAFVVSRTVTPLFLPRYFIPAAIGWAVVIAHLTAPAERVTGAVARRAMAGVWAIAFAILLLKPVAAAVAMRPIERPGLAIERLVPPDMPVVVNSAIDFLPYAHYSSRPGGYYYILDWDAAIDPRAELEATVDYKVMDAWRRNELLAPWIVPADAFLRAHDRFVVIDERRYGWYEHTLRDDPRYTRRELSDQVPVFGGTARAILVERAGAATGARTSP